MTQSSKCERRAADPGRRIGDPARRATRIEAASAWYCAVVERRRWWFIAGAILFAFALGGGGLFLERTADNRVFFGERNAEFQAFRSLEASYAESNNVLLAIAPADGTVFTAERLAVIRTLTETLWHAPYATRVDSITNYQYSRGVADEIIISDLVTNPAALTGNEIQEIRRFVLSEPLLTGLLISDDGRAAGININFQWTEESPTALDEIVAFLRTVTDRIESERPDLKIAMTGNVMIMSAFAEAGDLDLTTLVPLMCLVVAVIFLVLVRSFVALSVALAMTLLSTIAALGLAGWSGVVLSAGSTPAPLIILTITMAYSVHVLTKFLDDYRAGWSKREAIANAVTFNLAPISLISATTAIGFFSLNASDAPPFHDLGNIVGAGVIFAFIFSFTLVPALLHVLRVRRPVSPVRGTRSMRLLARFVVVHRQILFWAMLAVIAVLSVGIARIELNDDWVRYFDERFEFRTDTEFVLENLSGIDVLEYSLPATGERGVFEPAYLSTLERFVTWLRAQPEIINVNAITDVFKRLNRNLHNEDPAFEKLPDDPNLAAQYLLLYEMSLPTGLSLTDRIVVDRTASRVTVTARYRGTNLPSKDLRALADRISDWLAVNGTPGMTAQGSGLSLMFAHMSGRNISAMLFGTGFALLVISCILVFALRNARIGIASLVPNFVPPIMGFGLWGYLIGEIGVAVSVVAAITFGIVVDDTIHFLTKYTKGRRDLGKSPEEAIQYTFGTVGKPLTVTTLVLVAGFLVLAMSGFKVSSSMGLLTAMTLAFALVADFLFLPALLLKLDREDRASARDPLPLPVAGRTKSKLPSLEGRVAAYFERVKDGHPVRGGTPQAESIELWSNDYLSLASHPTIIDAQVKALASGDNGLCMPSAYLAPDGAHRRIEEMIAAFVGAEDAALCQSGWCANVALVQVLSSDGAPVYLDNYAHASLWEGVRLGDAAIRPFRHNSPQSLERMVRRHGPGIVIVDSIYSANGSICPLAEVVELCERHDCTLIVDESHAIGCYGEDGGGLVPMLGLIDKVPYRTFSLSKGFVTRAGVVTGPADGIARFRRESRPATFSSAILEHELPRLEATLNVIRQDSWRRDSLRRNVDYLRHHLSKMGYGVKETGSQVVALMAGTERRAIGLRDALERRGVFGAVFCYPATPKDGALIRFSVNCGLSRDDLDRVIEVTADIDRTMPVTVGAG